MKKTIDCVKLEDPQAGPEGCELVGYVDEYGNFEKDLWDWMVEEPGTIWRAVFAFPLSTCVIATTVEEHFELSKGHL